MRMKSFSRRLQESIGWLHAARPSVHRSVRQGFDPLVRLSTASIWPAARKVNYTANAQNQNYVVILSCVFTHEVAGKHRRWKPKNNLFILG